MSPTTLLVLGALLAPPSPIVLPPPDPIAGLVVDAEGRPVAEAEVFLVGVSERMQRTSLWRGRSDAQGRFQVDRTSDVVAMVPYPNLVAYHPGAWSAGVRIDLMATATPEDPVRLVLRRPVTVPVRVLGPDGKSVSGARLRWPLSSDLTTYPDEMMDRYSVTTDVEGRANLATIFPKSFRGCEVTAAGFGKQTVQCNPRVEGERPLALRTVGKLSGRIIADIPERTRRVLVQGMTLTGPIGPGSSLIALFEAVSDANGRFEVPALAAGELVIAQTRPSPNLFLPRVDGLVIAPGKPTKVEVVLKPGIPVRGTIRERGTGRPIAGVTATLFSDSFVRVRTDASGRYETFLQPGQVSLWLNYAGPYVLPSESRFNLATLPENSAGIDLPPVDLVHGVDVHGVVRDEVGKPVVRARVEARRPDGRVIAVGLSAYPAPVTNHRGEFLLRAATPDVPLEFSAYFSDAATGPPEPVVPDSAKLVTLVISRKNILSLGGRVVDEYGKPIAKADISVRSRSKTSAGVEALRSISDKAKWGLRTDAEGKYQTPRELLRHEEHQVIARAPGKIEGQSEWFAATTPSFFDLILYRVPPADQAEIRKNQSAGWEAFQRQNYAEAEVRFEAAVTEAEQKKIGEPVEQSRWLEGLAWARQARGKYAESEVLVRRVLAIREKALGAEHPAVAESLMLLARIRELQGKEAEAETLTRRALAIREHSLGPEHPKVALALAELARLLKKQQRLQESDKLFALAIRILEKTLGEESPELIAQLRNRALILAILDRLFEAEVLLQRAALLAEKTKGAGHPEVVRIIGIYVMILRGAGREAQAEIFDSWIKMVHEKANGNNAREALLSLPPFPPPPPPLPPPVFPQN